MKEHNKLVRDNIPDIIRNNNEIPHTHIADGDEYWQKLKEKLSEEVEEFHSSESPEELADILEVMYAMCKHRNFSMDSIEQVRRMKAQKKGSFDKKIVLRGVKKKVKEISS